MKMKFKYWSDYLLKSSGKSRKKEKKSNCTEASFSADCSSVREGKKKKPTTTTNTTNKAMDMRDLHASSVQTLQASFPNIPSSQLFFLEIL